MPSAVAISLSDWPCAASSRICTCRAVPRRLNTREATGSPGVSPQRSGWRPGLGSGWRPGLGLDSEELGLVGELGLAQGLAAGELGALAGCAAGAAGCGGGAGFAGVIFSS